MKKELALTGLVLLLAAVALSQIKEISGFAIPDYDEQNNLKSELSGEKARIKSEREIEITNLKIESYDDGQVEMTVTAPHCIYDREAGIAWSRSRIRIEREKMLITGEDFKYDSEDKSFEINKDVEVVLADLDRNIPEGEKR